ncbi:MAG: type II and III secretion system protein family protein [Hyphomicrobiaceae bacterium]
MASLISEARSLAVSGFVALLTLGFATADGHANGGQRRAGAGNSPVLDQSGSHQSVLRISARDRLPQVRVITLGRNKSMLVELPTELRDVVVSNPEIVDAMVQSSDRVYLIGKKHGQSNAFFFDSTGAQVLTVEITVENDTGPLDVLLRRLIPGSDIKSEILNDTVVLTGTVRSAVDSNRANDLASRFVAPTESTQRATAKVINMLVVEGEEQVMLKVVVAEVQREALKQFGVNLGAVINSGAFTTAVLSQNALPLTAAAGLGTLPIPGINLDPDAGGCAVGSVCNFNQGPAPKSFGNSGVDGGMSFRNGQINHALRALERVGLLRTLAEPNLTAVSGEAAKFLAGGEYPTPVVTEKGLSVTFKEFGISVAFTPVVLSESRISLKIETEVSELTNAGAVTLSGITIPALKKRTAKSTVELPSGGSLAMAGLLSDDVRQNIDGFPGLKDVPVLGTLFRSRDFIKRETELVVIVTPYTVRPTSRKELATPGDGLAPASDLRANFLGHLNRIYRREIVLPAGSLKDVGFIVE